VSKPTPLASVIIPTYNHGSVVSEAIRSALDQTVPVEVIVVDDGSTDDTERVLDSYGSRILAIRQEHSGPSAARNLGLDHAGGEFVMLLDADDVIAADKVSKQIAAFDAATGWVLCDVRIEDALKGVTTASQRYGYAEKDLGGWIQPLLAEGNFIPIMSPLVRRTVLSGIRFDDARIPEDWHFWHAVAGAARVRYVPEVLATYRKSKTGRSRIPVKARRISRNIEQPLRLNLGCGTPDTRSWHPMPGLVNLDKSLGWRFEDGLGEFVTGSVAGITVSHALMYVPLDCWPYVFGEFARVLAPGGVLRITEDDAISASSSRRGGWKGSQPAVTLTDAAMVRAHMERAGLEVHDVTADTSHHTNRSLCQAQHGAPPEVFFIEGVRMTSVLFAPHNDDETLFAAFTILRYRPRIVICFPSSGDYGNTATREAETREAMTILGGEPVEQWHGGNLREQMAELDQRIKPGTVFAPSRRCSHPDHIAVAEAAVSVFGSRVAAYQTYDDSGKVTAGRCVEFEPEWVGAKLRALTRYESQIRHPRAHQFFMWDLLEYASN
jgi:glycosyltransferase involved in cell wall biosynthesis